MFGPKPLRPLHHYLLPGLFVGLLFGALIWRRPGPVDTTGVVAEESSLVELRGETMGTYWSVKFRSDRAFPKLYTELNADLQNLNQSMSTYLPQSEISRFNSHKSTAPFPISDDFYQVLLQSRDISQKSAGAFDVTVKPLVDVWGFGKDKGRTPPTPLAITQAQALIGLDRYTLSSGRIQKHHKDVEIDLSAIAKGFGVDVLCQKLLAQDIKHFIVDIGGEIRAQGMKNDSQTWIVGVEQPDATRGHYEALVNLKNLAIATSGDYRNYYEHEGRRISHTIDPRTGQTIDHGLASVSVLHTSAMIADAWATALNVLGPKKALKMAQKYNLSVMLIIRKPDEQFDVKYTSSFLKHIVNPQEE